MLSTIALPALSMTRAHGAHNHFRMQESHKYLKNLLASFMTQEYSSQAPEKHFFGMKTSSKIASLSPGFHGRLEA